jgi:hypothetical protein
MQVAAVKSLRRIVADAQETLRAAARGLPDTAAPVIRMLDEAKPLVGATRGFAERLDDVVARAKAEGAATAPLPWNEARALDAQLVERFRESFYSFEDSIAPRIASDSPLAQSMAEAKTWLNDLIIWTKESGDIPLEDLTGLAERLEEAGVKLERAIDEGWDSPLLRSAGDEAAPTSLQRPSVAGAEPPRPEPPADFDADEIEAVLHSGRALTIEASARHTAAFMADHLDGLIDAATAARTSKVHLTTDLEASTLVEALSAVGKDHELDAEAFDFAQDMALRLETQLTAYGQDGVSFPVEKATRLRDILKAALAN